jgi:hypothetical protein
MWLRHRKGVALWQAYAGALARMLLFCDVGPIFVQPHGGVKAGQNLL